MMIAPYLLIGGLFMSNKEITQIKEITSDLVIDMIHEVRGQKVMLDFELAELYGYETKDLNRQVKNNIKRFPKEFMFKLNSSEFNNDMWCKNFTTSSYKGDRRRKTNLPYAFTEQGIYMLMTILKGDVAVQQSIALIKAFKYLKDYYNNTSQLPLNEYLRLNNQVNENTEDIKIIKDKLEIIMDGFEGPKSSNHYLFQNGKRLEADKAYKEIYKTAKERIEIIDDYIGLKTLLLLKDCAGIEIVIYSDNKAKECLEDYMISDFIKDTGINVTIKPTNDSFHDRYIFIDRKVLYHCGPSSKDAGNKVATIDIIEDIKPYILLIDSLKTKNNKKKRRSTPIY